MSSKLSIQNVELVWQMMKRDESVCVSNSISALTVPVKPYLVSELFQSLLLGILYLLQVLLLL